MHLRMIAKSNSSAARKIRKLVGIKMYTGKINKAQVLVNYGLTGRRLFNYYRKVPSAKYIPTLNEYIGKSKYGVINAAKKARILTPDTALILPISIKADEWLEKKMHSVGGFGIRKATHRHRKIGGKYFQKFIHNRLYELRVHAFLWTTDWVVQKRIGSKEKIAWNFSQGGHFVAVDANSSKIFLMAREISKKILEISRMSFGAVDFIVDKNYKLYFIEINSAPGFTNLSSYIYNDAFRKLKNLSLTEIEKLVY